MLLSILHAYITTPGFGRKKEPPEERLAVINQLLAAGARLENPVYTLRCYLLACGTRFEIDIIDIILSFLKKCSILHQDAALVSTCFLSEAAADVERGKEFIARLVEHGLDINALPWNSKASPLHLARRRGRNGEVLAYNLLANGALDMILDEEANAIMADQQDDIRETRKRKRPEQTAAVNV